MTNTTADSFMKNLRAIALANRRNGHTEAKIALVRMLEANDMPGAAGKVLYADVDTWLTENEIMERNQ